MTDLIAELRAARSAHDAELEELQTDLTTSESKIEELDDELSGIAIRREATQENQIDLDTAISDATSARTRVEKEISAARAAIAKAQKNLDLLKEEARTREETSQQNQQLLEAAEKSFAAIERALAEKESRLEILRQLNEEGEGLAQGSQEVLKGLGDPSRIQPALAGAFASKLDVDQKFVAAVEAALGRNLQAIVLQDAAFAPEIIATLTKKKLGQAALVIPKLVQFFGEEARQTSSGQSARLGNRQGKSAGIVVAASLGAASQRRNFRESRTRSRSPNEK